MILCNKLEPVPPFNFSNGKRVIEREFMMSLSWTRRWCQQIKLCNGKSGSITYPL